jgi:hypothetical protein
MADTQHILTASKEELELLREMAAAYKRRREFASRFVDEQDLPSPEVYVALTPTAGIPAISAPGTATATDFPSLLEPGYAECAIYRVAEDAVDGQLQVYLEPIYNLTKRVYNVSTNAIEGSKYVLATKDKCGIWHATAPGSGGGDSTATPCTITVVTSICRLGDSTGTA